MQNSFDPMTLVSPFTPYSYGSSSIPSSVTLPLPYPSPVSRLEMFSSAFNIAQQPSWIVVSGISNKKNYVLGSVNHPYLWSAKAQSLLIPLDSTISCTSVTVSVYLSSSELNNAHYYGALKLSSQDELFCEALDGFSRTWQNQLAMKEMRNATTKGFSIRWCNVVTNSSNPFDRKGVWDSQIDYFGLVFVCLCDA